MNRRSGAYLRLVFTLLIIYGLLCAGLSLGQRYVIYHPGLRNVTLDVGLVPRASAMILDTADNERLLAWFVPPRDASRPLYLYLHGNAGTLAARAERFALLTDSGAGLLAVSWRGYGGSTGSPTERGLQLDAEAAYAFAVTKVEPRQVILFGESLGSAVAIQLAAAQPAGALVLDAAYLSLPRVFEARAPIMPYARLLRDWFDAEAVAPQVTIPVLQRHCTQDPLLPYKLAQQLFDRFGTVKKTWLDSEGDCHLAGLSPHIGQLRQLEESL